MTGDVPAGERRVHEVWQRGRHHSVVKPQYQEGGTSKLTKGVADLLFGTNPGDSCPLCVKRWDLPQTGRQNLPISTGPISCLKMVKHYTL